VKRLWILISGYDDPAGLEKACRSVRKLWADPDQYPIVYTDGVYEKFQKTGERPRTAEVMAIAERFASLIVPWPVPAPTEFLKRSTYFVGNPGDYALILDTDETLECREPAKFLDSLKEVAYLVPIRSDGGSGIGRISRVFKIRPAIHHWGAHEVVFVGKQQIVPGMKSNLQGLTIIHANRHWDRERLERKRHYYTSGIRFDEQAFRQKVGA